MANQHNSHSSTERRVKRPSFLAVLTISASYLSSTASYRLFYRSLICTRIFCSQMQFKMPRLSKNFQIFKLNYFSKFILYQNCLWQNTTYLHSKSFGKDMDTSTGLNPWVTRETVQHLHSDQEQQKDEFLVGAITQGKNMEGCKQEKKKSIMHIMILYKKKPTKDNTKKSWLINTLSKVAAYKISTGKLEVSLYTNDKLSEKDIKKATVFTIA